METRITSAYESLKLSQQVLVSLLTMGDLSEAVKAKVSQALADLVHVQDALIVLRETLNRLEFDNATLSERLRDSEGHARFETAFHGRKSAPPRQSP